MGMALDLATDTNEDTLEWLATKPELLEPYVGEWVVLHDRRIIAHHPLFGEVIRLAHALGVEDPLLIPVSSAPYTLG
jgi:hypothetical protein